MFESFFNAQTFHNFRGRPVKKVNGQMFKAWPSIKSCNIINKAEIAATYSTTVSTTPFRLADFSLRGKIIKVMKIKRCQKLKNVHASRARAIGPRRKKKKKGSGTYRRIYKFRSQNVGCCKLLASLCFCTMANSPKFQSFRPNFIMLLCH